MTQPTEPMTDLEYRDHEECRCPNCRSQDIEPFFGEGDGTSEVKYRCSCRGCGATWLAVYVIEGYINLELDGNEVPREDG